MASVVEQKPDPAGRFDSLVDEQIAQATGRIRAHDLILGGLILAAVVACYATAMILLDKYLILAEWVRQLALVGFLGAFGAVAYLFVVRPLRKRINPLYAAAQVEKTIEDPKNSVTGYVEAQENSEVLAVVKTAMSARAARAMDDADLNRAVDHRSLLYAGGVVVVFLLTLIVLFFVFRPTQFSSLVSRAFVPFSSDPIATRTQLTLLKPEPPDLTVTTGQSVTVVVNVGGKVPAADGPNRVRVLIRHNPADPNYEELPMEQGETTRDWQVKVPEYQVQNGFWYKVAGGDAETSEHRVNVRSLPQFTDFEATFEYPAYTNKPNDRAADPHIRAYRGTKVTLVARTNREVKDGAMKFGTPGLAPVAGKPVAGKPDSLQFQFTVIEPTKYQLFMTTTGGERNADSPWFTVSLDPDNPPTVQITRPDQAETSAPANGQLAVDGTVGDDFGIDKIRVRMRVDNRDLAPVYYMDGKSLRREKDNTWPRDLRPEGFKLSADLTKLNYADGGRFEPKDKMVIEFWVEAIDNCTETAPVEGWGDKPQPGNVGRSDVYRLNLTPPRTDEADKQDLDAKKQQRQSDEKQHQQQQQKKLDNEKRDTKQQQQQQGKDGAQQPQPNEAQPEKKDGTDKKEGDKKDENPQQQPGQGRTGEPKKDNSATPKKDENAPKSEQKPEPKAGSTGEPKKDNTTQPKSGNDMGGMGGNDTKQPEAKKDEGKKADGKKEDGKKGDTPPMGGMNNTGTGDMDQAPMPKTPEEKRNEEQLNQDRERVQQELDKNKAEGGDAKPNPSVKPEDRTDPAQQKPQPKAGGEQQDSPPKEGAKSGDPGNPMQKGGDNTPAESKPAGNLEKPGDPAEQKPASKEPDPKDPKNANQKPAQPSETRSEPLGGTPGSDKPEPAKPESKKDGTQPKEPPKNTDPMSGSAGKPPTDHKDGDPENKPKEPPASAGTTKPNPEPSRGMDKDPTQAKGNPPPEEKPKDDPAAGGAKPQQPPPNAERKPPTNPADPMAKGKEPDASETKPEPKKDGTPMGDAANNASEPKPDSPPKGGDKGVEKGIDKEEAKNQPQGGQGDSNKEKKEPKPGSSGKGTDGKKLDEKQQKELEDAVKNLDNPDPKKREEARQKLDKAVGEQNRKEIEKEMEQQKKEFDQLKKDLDSPDKDKRDAAQKKLEEMAKKAGQEGKKGEGGKGLSQDELSDLQKKAQDLNSKDDAKRQQAEKEFDEKLGQEAREKLQEQMKNQPPMGDPKTNEELKKQLEEMAKNPPGRGKGPVDPDMKRRGPGASTEPPKDAMADDPRNRAKTAQLQLEEFEKHRYDNDLREKLGWSDDKWKKFLDEEAKRVEQLAKEAEKFEESLRNQPSAPPGAPTINLGAGSGKVEERAGVTGVTGTGSGAGFSPPGFEKAREDFLKKAAELKKKQ